MRLEEAYEKYADILYRLALSHLQHQQDAEDAVQEVFIRYLNRTKPFADASHEQAWLIRVTVNLCYDMLRHKNRHRYTALEDAAEITAEEPQDCGILQTLEKLPVKNRTVLVLYYLEGFSVEEIAFMLRISVSAVKMRMSRGRDQLKTILEEEESHV